MYSSDLFICCVVLARLAARVNAQCVSVVAAAEELELTQLLAGIELLPDAEAPAAAFVGSAIQGEAESLVRYTIFAPDDAAFATTFPGGIDDPDVFYGVLGSAALSGDWTVATLIEEIQAAAEEGEVRKKALNGKTIVFTTDANATSLFVRLSDQEETPPGQVVIADTETCAGTVQVIDAVMLPDDEVPGQEVAAAPGPASFSDDPLTAPLDPATDLAAPVPSGLNGTSNSTGCISVAAAATLVNLTDFATLMAGVEEAPSGLVVSTAVTAESAISSQFTVFAPVDLALRTAISINTAPDEELVDVLSTHMVSGVFSFDELVESAAAGGLSGHILPTMNGESLKLTTDGMTLWILPEGSDASIAPASVTRKDVETCAGVMHVVDGVLVPSGMEVAVSPLSQPNVVDIPPGTPRLFENPEEGEAAPPEDTDAEVGTDADTSGASRRSYTSGRFQLLPVSLSTAAAVCVLAAVALL